MDMYWFTLFTILLGIIGGYLISIDKTLKGLKRELEDFHGFKRNVHKMQEKRLEDHLRANGKKH